MKYPSSKNTALLAFAALIIIGAFLISDYEKRVVAAQEYASGNNGDPTLAVATTTMYNTPIAYQGDWQQALVSTFGTSSAWTNGVADGSGGSGAAAASNTLTPTDIFSEDLFSKYSAYAQAGADLTDPQTQQQLIGQVMADGTYLPTAKVYTKSNFKISPDNSLAAIIAYGNTAGTILQENVTVHAYETDIVQESLTKDDPSVLTQLNPIISNYQAMIRDLLATKVPSDMADYHVDLVNALSELLFADQSLTKIYSDGVESLNGLTYYKNGVADLNTAMTEIAEYFASQNISFGPNDGGYVFISRLQMQ